MPHLYKKWLEIRPKNLRRYQIESLRMYYVPQDGTLEIRTKFLGGPHWGPQNLFLATMGLETSSFHNGV